MLAETEVLPWKEDVQRVMGHIIGRQLQLGPGGSQAQDAFSSQACPVPPIHKHMMSHEHYSRTGCW